MRIALICVLVAGLLPYLWTAVAKAMHGSMSVADSPCLFAGCHVLHRL